MADARKTSKRQGASSSSSKGSAKGRSGKASRSAKGVGKSAKGAASQRSGPSAEARSSTSAKPRTSRSASRESASSKQDSSASAGSRSSASRSNTRGLSTLDAVTRARRSLSELLGRPVEAVLGAERNHSTWTVIAQVVELERIPNTTDVLGEYEAVLDRDGEVLSYHKTRRYHRGNIESGQG